MSNLQGKTAIVTGAGRGLGEATALVLAGEGAAVAVVDLVERNAKRVADAIEAAQGAALPLAADVGDEGQVRCTIDDVLARFGRIDVLVNNAAIDHTVSIDEMTIEQWDAVIRTNLRGPFLFSKMVFPVMRGQGGGHIVNVASTAAKRTWANCAAYHSSKAGLIAFTRALGVEGRPHGIRATALIPGGMNTPFFDRLDVPPDLRNLNDPRNVARAIAYVVSQPPDSVIQELLITPLTETSWP